MSKFFTYVGFSTSPSAAVRRRNWKLYDNDLIRRDLLLHFNTRVGDRIGRPNWGCKVWDYLMEQKTADTVDLIRESAEEVIDSDTRVSRTSVEVYEYDHGVIIACTLTNKVSGDAIKFKATFDALQGTIS